MASGVLLRAEAVLLLMLAVVSGGRMAQASAPDSNQPRVGGPYLAAIVAPELEPSTDWYQKHLGFQRQETVTLPDLRIAFLVLDGFHLELVEDKRAYTREGLEKRIPEMKHQDNAVDGITKLAFRVTGLDAFAAKLRSENVRFQTGIMEAKGNWPRSFIVLDNNGNWIQFVESTGDSVR